MTARTGRRPSAVPSPAPHRSSATPGSVDRAGFTLLELLLVITMAAILMAIGSRGARVLPREPMEERIARTILGEISVARTYAIRANVPVSLVIDESNRRLIIRETSATAPAVPEVYRTTTYGTGSDVGVVSLSTENLGSGTSQMVNFSGRGFCLNCTAGGTSAVLVGRRSRPNESYRIIINQVGRAFLNGLAAN